jgi:hypothetical protein
MLEETVLEALGSVVRTERKFLKKVWKKYKIKNRKINKH